MHVRKGRNGCHLPCAGITLFRFYGYDLRSGKAGTPRGTVKIKKEILFAVTFVSQLRTTCK
jgi:hypothetical protein